MRLLVVDVGNSATAVGMYDGDRLTSRWRLTTTPRTADEHRLLVDQMLDGHGPVDGAALGSVVPAVTQALRPALQESVEGPVIVVGPGVRSGLAINVDNAREVGADRIANAVGAIDRHGAPVVCVDFGTATTVDLVGAAGDYLGGVIAPGVAVGAEALISATSALRRVEIVAPPTVVGRSTATAIQSGLVYGTAAMVDGLVERVAAEHALPEGVPVVATGGMAADIAAHSARITQVEEDLTLWGLRIVFERNV